VSPVRTCHGLRREAQRHAAFVRTKTFLHLFTPRAGESARGLGSLQDAGACHRARWLHNFFTNL
jgi:hypothetical protein